MERSDPWRANDFFGTILDLMNDAVTGIDAAGRVQYWNKAAEDMYGIPRDDIVGRKIGEFFPKESVMLFQVIKTGRPVNKVYHRPRPDMHVFISAAPVYNGRSELIGAVAIEQDITSLIRLSEEQYALTRRTQAGPEDHYRSAWIEDMVGLMASTSPVGSPYPFLLMGEPGVGKRTLAELAHQRSGRTGPFVTVACDSLPSGLVDLELFGYEGDVFDSEEQVRLGKLELAEEGTIYLTNIEALPLATQHRLAQALHDRGFARTGGTRLIPLRCQVLASSAADLPARVAEGHFAQKLYYAFHHLVVPPLRDRKDELQGLCRYFLVRAAAEAGRPVPRLTPEVLAALGAHDWAGNLSELRHTIQYLVRVAGGAEVTLEHLPDTLRPTTLTDLVQDALPLPLLSEEMEKARIEEALQRSGGNKANAARMLGISRGSLYYKMRQYGIGHSKGHS